MGKNTAASFAGLNKLSVLELGRSIERVVRCERQEVAAVIAHLAEMARRDAHLELGYKNLFDYCVKHLRLSEGSVWSRLQVANVCRKYPQVLERRRKKAAAVTKPRPDEADREPCRLPGGPSPGPERTHVPPES